MLTTRFSVVIILISKDNFYLYLCCLHQKIPNDIPETTANTWLPIQEGFSWLMFVKTLP